MFGIKKIIRDLTTNHAALEPAAEDPELRPVVLPLPLDSVADRIDAWTSGESRWSLVDRQPTGDGIRLHLTRTTPLFRFVDDVRVLLSRDGEQTRVDAESQSRVGKGDLGQNPKNLKELTRMLRQQNDTT